MRKMIPVGNGKRVHFSIPDHEWEWFASICQYDGKEPFDLLFLWADAGAAPTDLRRLVRSEIKAWIDDEGEVSG